MRKSKTIFYCKNCGGESSKWMGRCVYCKEWNTLKEEKIIIGKSATNSFPETENFKKPVNIIEIVGNHDIRSSTQIEELDRVLGGGMVEGSLILVGGNPGIGKSTLLLQLAIRTNKRTLYVSGEESYGQIKLRADRLGISNPHCFLLSATLLQEVLYQTANSHPDILIIDSIQTLYSEELDSTVGSISQVKECTLRLMNYAKKNKTIVFLIGHVNKEGGIAGPKVLEHMVDTVLYFEGDKFLSYRMIRTIKNRFGTTSEIGIFEMQNNGLREVKNPSEILLSSEEDPSPGIALGTSMEGNRSLILESQVLVSPSYYGQPQRSSTGYDYKRLMMLLAVLEKRLGIKLGSQDVFSNIAGGIKVYDPAIDLSICVAVLSSHQNHSILKNTCFVGEVGLGGEIRPVQMIDRRLREMEKLGMERVYLSKYNMKVADFSNYKLEIGAYSKLEELFNSLF